MARNTRSAFEILIVHHFISLLLNCIPCFIIHEITTMSMSRKKMFTIVLSILLFPHYIDCTTSKVTALATVANAFLAVTGKPYQYRIEHNTSYGNLLNLNQLIYHFIRNSKKYWMAAAPYL